MFKSTLITYHKARIIELRKFIKKLFTLSDDHRINLFINL